MKEYFWQGKPWRAFKNFAIIFSFVMNLILLLTLLLAAPIILPALNSVGRPLVGGLAHSFVEMGDATIVRTIEVEDNVPVVFDLPLQQRTAVVLEEPVPLSVPATFNLPGGGGTINGVVSLQLPSGMVMPIQLDMVVPVSHTLPIDLDVAVNIPLEETELGPPFQTLQELFIPLDLFLRRLPGSNDELMERIAAEPWRERFEPALTRVEAE